MSRYSPRIGRTFGLPKLNLNSSYNFWYSFVPYPLLYPRFKRVFVTSFEFTSMLCSQQWNTVIHNSRNLWNIDSARNASLLRFFLHGTARVGLPISRISRRREGGKRAREEMTDNPPFQASKGKKEGGGDSHPWDPNFSTVPPPLPTISQKMQPDIVRWPLKHLQGGAWTYFFFWSLLQRRRHSMHLKEWK